MRNVNHDIERYLSGEMTPTEMHALEREALDDPFLAEALEGLQAEPSDAMLLDLRRLRKGIKTRQKKRRVKMIPFWAWSIGIAAGFFFIAMCVIYLIKVIERAKAEKREREWEVIQHPTDTLDVAMPPPPHVVKIIDGSVVEAEESKKRD